MGSPHVCLVIHHWSLLRPSHRQDAGLWWVDDGREALDAVHAQVGDGEGPSLELLGLQLPRAGLLCQNLGLLADGPQTLGVGQGVGQEEGHGVRQEVALGGGCVTVL